MATEPDIQRLNAVREAEELRKANRQLEQRLRQAKAKTEDLIAAVHQAAKDAALIQGNPPAVPKPGHDRRSKRAEAALLVLSDWHVGKRSSSYNSTIAADRIRLLGEKTAVLTEIERADHPVRECHALLTGDMADNVAIFPGHAHEVDSTMFQQVFTTVSIMEQLLRRLLATFETVHVWEAAGNHGRIGKRGDYPRVDNLDLLIYRLCRERLSEYEGRRLVWHPAETWFSIVEIGRYRCLQIHGDQIKSFGGNVPAFGIARKANAWASGVLPDFVDIMLGHFHQPLAIPLANGNGRAFVNPSTESGSEYAREFVAATGTPGQRLFFVDPEKARITSERIVWLDDPPAEPRLKAVA